MVADAVFVGRDVTVIETLVDVAVGVTVEVDVGSSTGVFVGSAVEVDVGAGVFVGARVAVGGSGVAEDSGEATDATGVAVGVVQAAARTNTLNMIKLRRKLFMILSLK